MDVSENEIGLREGRAKFGDLVNRAEYAGQTTYITRHGRRVAAIVPINQEQAMTRQDLTDAVTATLRPHAHLHDVAAIVAEIGGRYGYDLDDVPATEYWAIVEQH